MWQFEQAVRGLADGCAQLGIPVTGGNVSFYNQTGSTAILPTPGGRRARRDRRRGHPDPHGSRRAGRHAAAARRDPRRVRRFRVGARGARPPGRPAAGGRPGARAATRRGAAWRRCRRRPTTCPRAVSPRRWWRRACSPAPARRSRCRVTRSWRCSASRPAAVLVAVPAAEVDAFTARCGRPAVATARHGDPGPGPGDRGRRRAAAGRAARGLGSARCRRCSTEESGRAAQSSSRSAVHSSMPGTILVGQVRNQLATQPRFPRGPST